jgi:large subunit ribosomal protein L3
MSIGILGKKLGMSQFFDEQGKSVPVTLIEAGPCRITQLKSSETDGYQAVQIGFGEIREKLINKPAKGHLAKSGEDLVRHLCEYRVDDLDGIQLGGEVTVGDFAAGQKVDVSGDTMGRGFSGLQKRHGFSRGPMTHGSKNHRQPGSIGAGTTPGRIYPGKRMSGRYGGKKNHHTWFDDPENRQRSQPSRCERFCSWQTRFTAEYPSRKPGGRQAR